MPTGSGSGSRKGRGKSTLIKHVSTLQNLVVGRDGDNKSKSRNGKRPRESGLMRLSIQGDQREGDEDADEVDMEALKKRALGKLSPLGKGGYKHGDLFGTRGDYIEGMIYQSRGGGSNYEAMSAMRQGSRGFAKLAALSPKHQSPNARAERRNPFSPTGQDSGSTAAREKIKAEEGVDFINVCWKTVYRAKLKAQKSDLHSLQEAAGALRNIVDNPELHPLLIKNGIISGIKALLERTRDTDVVRSCSDALCTLAHNSKIQAALVDEGLIEMLIYFMRGSAHLKALAPRNAHRDMLCNCAHSILALSANAGPLQGQLQVSMPVESRLVREGPLSELQKLQHRDTAIRWAMLKMVFNLAALGTHLPCLWLEDIMRVAIDSIQHCVRLVTKHQLQMRQQRLQKISEPEDPPVQASGTDEAEFYALIILLQTLSRLSQISGVSQALLTRDITHHISAVVAISHECIMNSGGTITEDGVSISHDKRQAVELLELCCILLYYLSQSAKVAPRMIEAQVPELLRDIWSKLLELRICPSSAELQMPAVSLELTTVTVAVLGNLARNAFARVSLIEGGLTAELALLAQEHTQHLKMRTSGVAAASSGGATHDTTIDPVLSEKLLSTAVAALQEIASDDNSAGNIAKQGALRMLNVVATFASELKLRAKAIVTICNMLSTGELESLLLHVEDDMQDALDVLVMLHREIISDFDIAKSGFIATALHNLSCTAAGRRMMKRIGEGVVETTVWVAQQQAPLCTASHQHASDCSTPGKAEERAAKADEVVALCSGTLFNLSSDKETSRMLMQRKWIRGVIDIMKQSKMSKVDELCIATLHNLSHGYDKAGRVYAGEGALEELIDLANNPLEPSAQELALKTLCILTTESDNVPPMVRRGLVGALVQASRAHHLAECATIGLNNLAEYRNGQLVGKLIEEGAVDILIDHIANKDPTIRGYSVLAVCHLACACSTGVVLEPEKGQHCLSMMRRHGAIEALLLAGFVRSSEDSKDTQQACCKGLYALLASAAKSGETEQLTTWQVVRASVTMLELGNEIRNFATVMLVNISCSEEGRELFTGMGFDALNDVALGRVSPPPTLEIRKRIVKILHNMLFLTDPTSVFRKNTGDNSDDEDGSLLLMGQDQISGAAANHSLNDEEDGEHSTLSSFFASAEDDGALKHFDPNSLENMEKRDREIQALSSRCKRIVMANGVPTLMSLSRIEDPDCRLMCAIALSTIANNPGTHARFVFDGGFRAMTEMAHYDRTDVGTSACWSIRMCCVRTAAYASRQPESRLRCVVDGVCEMLVQAVQSTTFAPETKHLCCQTIELFSRGEKARPFMAQQGIVEALDHLLGVASSKNKEAEAVLFARTIRNLSFSDAATEDILVEFGVVHLFHSFAEMPIESVAVDCAVALCNVFQKTSHDNAATLIHDHALRVIQSILSHGGKDPFSHHAEEIREACAACILSMAIQEESREFLVAEGIFQTIHQICTEGNPTDQTIDACCRALCVFCLDPAIRPLVVRKKSHTNVVGLHSIFARKVKLRRGVRGMVSVSQSRLALALLNLARIGETDTQSDIINHCDASALLEQASALTDKERGDINEPVLIDIDRRKKMSSLSVVLKSQDDEENFKNTIEIPEVYSFTRSESWPSVSFRTDPVRTTGLDDRDTLDLAPRWKEIEGPTGLEALKQAVNKGHSSDQKSGGDTSPKENMNEESSRNAGAIIVDSTMMHRLNSRLNKSYGSTVGRLRYASQAILLERDAMVSTEGSSILLSASSMFSGSISNSVADSDIDVDLDSGAVDVVKENVVSDSLMDSSLIMYDSIAKGKEMMNVGIGGDIMASVVPTIRDMLEGPVTAQKNKNEAEIGEQKLTEEGKNSDRRISALAEQAEKVEEKLPTVDVALQNPNNAQQDQQQQLPLLQQQHQRVQARNSVVLEPRRIGTADRKSQNEAKQFLMTMRSRSSADMQSQKRALASGLCETLALLTPSGTKREQQQEQQQHERPQQSSEQQHERLPPVVSSAPASPKMSGITFAR